MASKRLDQQLEKLRNKGQKELFSPSKGLMDILAESRDIESDSKTHLGDILENMVEMNEKQTSTFERMDFGVGKINKIISDAISTNLPSQQVEKSDGNSLKFFQSAMEHFSLIQLHKEDELQLQRGILFNVTQILGILTRAEKLNELLKDKKQFKMPEKKEKKETKLAEAYGWGDFLKGLGKIGALAAFLLKPLKWLGSKLWGAVKSVFKSMNRAIKRQWIKFLKVFKKTFPKAYEFTKKITHAIDDFFKVITKKLPKFADDAVKGISGFFKGGIGKALKVIGKAAFWVDMAYSFFQGIFNAKAITGKDQVDLKDKIISGVMGMLSSLTFGFVKPEDWYDVVMGDYGLWYHLKEALKGVWEMMPDSIKNVFKGVGDLFSFAYDEADKVFMQFTGGWSMSKVLSKLLDDVAKWVEEKVTFKNLNPFNWGRDPEVEALTTGEKKGKDQYTMSAAKRDAARARGLPKKLDTSALHHSNKIAAETRKQTEHKTLVNVPPPTVIQAPANTNVNMFEPDQMAIVTGGTR